MLVRALQNEPNTERGSLGALAAHMYRLLRWFAGLNQRRRCTPWEGAQGGAGSRSIIDYHASPQLCISAMYVWNMLYTAVAPYTGIPNVHMDRVGGPVHESVLVLLSSAALVFCFQVAQQAHPDSGHSALYRLIAAVNVG